MTAARKQVRESRVSWRSIYFGGGGGAPGFLTPVVSYAPRPMLKADKSRRIILSSAQAIMVRQVETAGKERCCDRRDARAANALRRVRNEMKNSPGKHHEQSLYRYFPRPENRQTNELPIHPPKQVKTMLDKDGRCKRWMQVQSRSERRSFLKKTTGTMRAPADCRAGM